MAVLALGLAGAALGNALVPGVIAFGITGASAGWMIGSAIGSMLGSGVIMRVRRARVRRLVMRRPLRTSWWRQSRHTR